MATLRPEISPKLWSWQFSTVRFRRFVSRVVPDILRREVCVCKLAKRKCSASNETCLVVDSELRRRKFLRIVKPSKFKFLIESRLKASEESAKLKEKTSSSSFPDRD